MIIQTHTRGGFQAFKPQLDHFQDQSRHEWTVNAPLLGSIKQRGAALSFRCWIAIKSTANTVQTEMISSLKGLIILHIFINAK